GERGVGFEAQLVMDGPASLVRPVSKARLAWRYLSRAMLHPYNLIALTGVMLLALVNWSGWVLLVGLALEAMFLGALPWGRPFRGRVVAAVEAAERAALTRRRAGEPPRGPGGDDRADEGAPPAAAREDRPPHRPDPRGGARPGIRRPARA